MKTDESSAAGAPVQPGLFTTTQWSMVVVGVRVGQDEPVEQAVQRLRRRYWEAIREEIAQTVATAAEVDEESRRLVSVFSS